MKKKTIKISLKKIICFILAIVVIYYGGMMVRAATTPTTDITFQDDNLYKSLKTRITSSAIISSNDGTKTLSIATDSIPTITQLDLSGSSISNLSGIEYFTGLTTLNLSRNSISDISKLSNLKSLTDLDLGTNSITNIDDISTLTSLTSLKISSNRISNIEPIRSLTKLQTLDLSNNAISDAKAVQSLRSLTSLDISSNSSLANLSDVLMSQLKVLDVDSTAIRDIEGIDNYGNLRELILSNNAISTLAPLFEEEEVDDEDVCKLRGLEKLDVSFTTKTGFSFSNLQGITSLKELYAQGNGITNVRNIVGLENLEYINLNDNEIEDISPFRVETTKNGEKVVELIGATQISLANNEIEDISVLGSLPQIDYLNLEGNHIANISAIERFDFAPSRLNLKNQTIEMAIYKKQNNQNHYIILYDIMQSAKEPGSVAYDENAYFTTEGATLNDGEIYNQSPYYNVIITPDKTDDDTLSVTLHGGVADGSKINFGISSSSRAVETLLFEDPNLDAAIYKYLVQHMDEDSYIARAPYIINITQSEIRETTELDLSSAEIQNLKGLSNFYKLAILNISNNKISDDSEIAYLTDLENLNFANNQLNNHYSSIEKLTKLVTLDLSGNNIQDLNSLDKYITNLEVEGDDPELTNLTLANNEISDLKTLEKLTTLQVLNISSNNIEDISCIGNNTNMNNLNISGNNIEDISIISNLRNIKTLIMSNCNLIHDIRPISNLSLTTLDISGNMIEDITPISNQTALEYLYMNDNKISDINSIEDIILKGGLEAKRQKIVRVLDDNTEGTVEIPLPEIFKSSKDTNSKVYTATDFNLENCTLSGDGNSIQINTDELGNKVARATIVGGTANETTFTVAEPLKATVTYNPAKENGKTKENVTATVSFNRNATILNNEGNTYTFTKNDEFTFIYEDEYGFTGEITATVDWIDNQGPQATVSYSIEEITNQDVEVTITTDEKISNQVEGWEFTDANQTTMKKTYSSNTEEKVNIQDELGNNTEVTISVTNIDKTPPTIQGVTNGQTYDQQSVTPNITDDNLDIVTLTRDGTPVSNYTNGQAITVNGEYVLTARDKAGNETRIEFTITGQEETIDDTITSSEYTVDAQGSIIDRISHDTTLSAFKNNISTEVGYKVTDTSGNEIGNSDLIGTGYKLTTDSGKEYTLIVTGDLNSDGRVTMTDISRIKKMYLGTLNLDDEYKKASDMNDDEQITMVDISRLKKVYLGL